jgi:hypothetical protein
MAKIIECPNNKLDVTTFSNYTINYEVRMG